MRTAPRTLRLMRLNGIKAPRSREWYRMNQWMRMHWVATKLHSMIKRGHTPIMDPKK